MLAVIFAAAAIFGNVGNWAVANVVAPAALCLLVIAAALDGHCVEIIGRGMDGV